MDANEVVVQEHLRAPDLSAQQQANELIRLIRKLRWMGMEEEAERVHAELAQCGAQPADSVVAAPRPTCGERGRSAA
jgi:hypothetical protein